MLWACWIQYVSINGYISLYTVHLYSNIWATYPLVVTWYPSIHCMFPLEWPKMAPFCMKITKHFLGRPPDPPPLNHNCFRFYNVLIVYIIKWKSSMQPLHLHILYAHTGSLQKYKKKSPGKSCPASLLNQHSIPLRFLFFFFAFPKFRCWW